MWVTIIVPLMQSTNGDIDCTTWRLPIFEVVLVIFASKWPLIPYLGLVMSPKDRDF